MNSMGIESMKIWVYDIVLLTLQGLMAFLCDVMACYGILTGLVAKKIGT